MTGPPPISTALKVLRGNPGKKRLPRSEPKPSPAPADPPAGLPPSARAIWLELAPELARIGLLTTVDVRELATGCRFQALGEAFLATCELDIGKKLKPRTDLWAAIKCLAQASAIFSRFGVTPSDRVRLSVPAPPRKESKWGNALEREDYP
jgi:phage terminase small subunit